MTPNAKTASLIATLAGIALLLTGWGEFDQSRQWENREIGWMQRGMDAVRQKLKDPTSAKFQGVLFSSSLEGAPLTCGSVNAKNGFGGYMGFQRFISAGSPELTYLESEVSDFQTVWDRACQ